ncbi:carbohydrate ABC transporter permease [Paenibacillus thalictri]|uniref:Sugar ABC transporter permease n=1 Tax=Paenibacillus thalictri TaxID=2527873 RepID=A0A4V2J4X4_9BACL|nr:sugar ABC transporter permease [Paenibacillus thalictri]TBL81542.1 sugar ABC transporter permease [Paenibacillus thalictri]
MVLHKWRKNVGLLYILPWIIGFLGFQLYPLISSLIYSFTDLSTFGAKTFIGLDNYIYMFTKDPDFYQSLKVTLLYAIMAVPGRVAFALFIALLLHVQLKGISVFRTLYYLPSIFGGSVAISVLWRFLFQKEGGAINSVLGLANLGPLDWFSPTSALITLAIIPVWQFGSSMVLFLAALKQVPKELYEAAKMDGAAPVRVFFNITVPIISPIILFNLIIQSVSCLQEFTSAFAVTGGGPNKATYVYAIKIYQEGFSFFKMGYASALSWFLFFVIMAFTYLIFKSSTYWTYYEDGEGGGV